MPKGQKAQPLVAVFCRCGAAWFGKYATDNPVIDRHRARCGPPVSVARYEALGWRIKWPQWWTRRERRNELRDGAPSA